MWPLQILRYSIFLYNTLVPPLEASHYAPNGCLHLKTGFMNKSPLRLYSPNFSLKLSNINYVLSSLAQLERNMRRSILPSSSAYLRLFVRDCLGQSRASLSFANPKPPSNHPITIPSHPIPSTKILSLPPASQEIFPQVS